MNTLREPAFIVIEKQDTDYPAIVTNEDGSPKFFDTYEDALHEKYQCQDGQVVKLT